MGRENNLKQRRDFDFEKKVEKSINCDNVIKLS